MFSIQVWAQSKDDVPNFEIVCSEEEFLNSENKSDWFTEGKESTGFCGFGAWEDGSFFLHYEKNINIYNSDGSFSHRLVYSGSTPIWVLTEGNDVMHILIGREDFIVTLKNDGTILDGKFVTHEENDIFDVVVDNDSRKYFSPCTYQYEVEDGWLTLQLPSRISFPFSKNSHIIVTKTNTETNTSTVIFDDGGIFIFNHFLLVCILLIVIIFTITIVYYTVFKKKIFKHLS